MKKIFKKAVAMTMATAMVCSMGCGKKSTDEKVKEEMAASTVVTIGDMTYTTQDLMYYIYNEEETGSMYDDIYQQFYGTTYWDMPDEEQDNKTGEQIAKENVMKNVKQDAIFCQEAKKAGYTLSDADKKTAQENYDDFLSNLNDQQKAVAGMGNELLNYFQNQVLVDDYKAQLLEDSKFDYDKVEDGVSKEKCREYDYEYYAIYKDDDDGNALSTDKLNSRLQKLQKLQKKVTKDSDMEKLVPSDMKDYLEYSDDYIVEEDGEAYGSYNNVDVDAELKSLANGQVSGVLETDFAYFVFRMKDNNSTDYYDESVDTAVSEAESELFNTAMENVADQYPVSINEEAWANVVIGNMVYNIGEDADGGDDGLEIETE